SFVPRLDEGSSERPVVADQLLSYLEDVHVFPRPWTVRSTSTTVRDCRDAERCPLSIGGSGSRSRSPAKRSLGEHCAGPPTDGGVGAGGCVRGGPSFAPTPPHPATPTRSQGRALRSAAGSRGIGGASRGRHLGAWRRGESRSRWH